MSGTTHEIKFETTLLKVGKSSIYARIHPAIVKNLQLHSKQKGTSTIKNGEIVLSFK